MRGAIVSVSRTGTETVRTTVLLVIPPLAAEMLLLPTARVVARPVFEPMVALDSFELVHAEVVLRQPKPQPAPKWSQSPEADL